MLKALIDSTRASFKKRSKALLQRAYATHLRSDTLFENGMTRSYIDTKRTFEGKYIFVIRMEGGDCVMSSDVSLQEMRHIAQVASYLVEAYRDITT